MRKINQRLIFILLIIIMLSISTKLNYNISFAQTSGSGKWYVDKNANGSNNGASWENAWESFSAINWGSIQAGDTLFISGGSDSTVYTEQLNIGAINGTSNNRIVITKGRNLGHDGEVIIDGQNSLASCITSTSSGRNYYTVSHFTLRNHTSSNGALRIENSIGVKCSYINIPSATNTGIRFRYNTDCAIDHLTYTTPSYSSSTTDGIFFAQCTNTTIEYCNITISNNNNSTHDDCIQKGAYTDWADGGTIRYNRLATPNTDPINAQGIYLEMVRGTWNIYGNLIDGGEYVKSLIYPQKNYSGIEIPIINIYNNTIISGGSRAENMGAMRFYAQDNMTVNFYNNIVVSTDANSPLVDVAGATCNADYNIWYAPNMSSAWDYGTWNNWKINHDTNGYNTNPLLNANYQPDDIRNPPVDNGLTLGSPYNFDILGISRPQGEGFDIGAFEYIAEGGGVNDPPSTPSDPNPPNAAINQLVNLTLSWSCSDPDGDPLTYDVYFGTSNNPALVSANQSSTNYNPGQLIDNTTYYWKIVAMDNEGHSTSSPVWNFSTLYIDRIPPQIVSAGLQDSVTLQIIFTEPLEQISAQDISNYSISNGIQVLGASLSGSEVTLSTTIHTTGQYTITADNIKDLAGNKISSNNSIQYTFSSDTSFGDLKANIKIFLEGAYLNGNMMTELINNELIPIAQPYNSPPWNYNGSEVLITSLNTVVDWILIELRNSLNPEQVIVRKAGLLRNDGSIMEPDGSLGIIFNDLEYGEYYISIYHRNHLPVMSALPISFSPENVLYDFTTSLTKAYGIYSMSEIKPGLFGMYAGDADGSGFINDTDRNDIWYIQSGNVGYLNGDYNLDSGVTIKDVNEFWNMNQGKKSQVP